MSANQTRQICQTSNLRPVWAVILVAILGIGGNGFISRPNASENLSRPIGDIPMTTSSVETFDGAWIVQSVKDIDLTGLKEMRFDFVAGTLHGLSPCRSFKTTFGPDPQNMMFTLFDLGGGFCDEERMLMEREFFDQIEVVDRMEIDGDGCLVMYKSAKVILRAKRLAE